jgi:hypothetical protein
MLSGEVDIEMTKKARRAIRKNSASQVKTSASIGTG